MLLEEEEENQRARKSSMIEFLRECKMEDELQDEGLAEEGLARFSFELDSDLLG